MDNNNQSDSSYSESDLEAEELELEALELAMALRRVEYYQNRNKIPCYTGGLTGHVTLIEAVAICLCILSHWAVMRVVAERFQRSKDTIYRQFKRVLKGLYGLAPHIIREQNRGQQPPPPEIKDRPKFYPYFKKCIGAIDETHISAWAPAHKQNSYRDRKVKITQNIMCVCSFDMMFTFVYTGWKGTANDSRVFLDAIGRPGERFSPF
ncbi:hypothetical protein Dsin_007148 [Dipteronia sinensis]|uniref:DUF8040 domain-containing protein n=1 Tax=Dipteronia sinensis TaxID=43782 RepID=A0AAE0EGA2_9ROSI|nr:hypothetical protein Dsin_007148 [Dipteronia sinensis]